MKQQNKLYSQNKIASILGISRGTFSKWLKENSVSPKQLDGQKKLYDETVIEQYKKSKSRRKNGVSGNSKRVTTVELLQNSLEEKQKEIDYLRKQLEEKDEQIKAKDSTIADFGDKFATLADQAQKLNLADKKQPKLEDGGDQDSVSETVETGEQRKRRGLFHRLFGKE